MTQAEIKAILDKNVNGMFNNGDLLNIIATSINENAIGGGAKVYAAMITQTASNDPEVTVLQNMLDDEISWVRLDTGYYYGTLVGAFKNGNVIVRCTPNIPDDETPPAIINAGVANADSIQIKTFRLDGNQKDSMLYKTGIEIIVYP